MMKAKITTVALCLTSALTLAACSNAATDAKPANGGADAGAFRDQPLVSEIFTADPSAHVFDGKI